MVLAEARHGRRVLGVEASNEHRVRLVAASGAATRRCPLSNSIDGQDCSFCERRRKERAGAVRFVMVEKDEPLAVFAPEGAAHLAGQVQLLP